VPKVYIPFTEKVNISYEFDPGICISRYYIHTDNDDLTKADQLFSLTHGLIVNIYSITASCRFNVAYSSYKIQWVTFNIGYEWIARLAH
jgi:hypothetical protein